MKLGDIVNYTFITYSDCRGACLILEKEGEIIEEISYGNIPQTHGTKERGKAVINTVENPFIGTEVNMWTGEMRTNIGPRYGVDPRQTSIIIEDIDSTDEVKSFEVDIEQSIIKRIIHKGYTGICVHEYIIN